MKKFSNWKPEELEPNKREKVAYSNDYMKVIDYEGWSLIKEKDLVVCIPYFIETNQFLIRQEYIPTFKYDSGQEFHITVLSGGIESGEDAIMTLRRELEEEAGIILNDNYSNYESLKPLYMSKGNMSKYNPFILPISERDYKQVVPTTDGSKEEKKSKSALLDVKYIDKLEVSDLITGYMLFELKKYLNI